MVYPEFSFRDDRGLVAPLDDNTIFRLLELVESGRRSDLDREVNALIDEVSLA
jgi:hypothetical protein